MEALYEMEVTQNGPMQEAQPAEDSKCAEQYYFAGAEELSGTGEASSPVAVILPPKPAPVRSLAQVRFANGRVLTYYNDQFCLKKYDWVYVSGKLAGIPGQVVMVTTRFRIHTADYERVIACMDFSFHGSFGPVLDGSYYYAGDPCTLVPEQVRRWVIPPRVQPAARTELTRVRILDEDDDEFCDYEIPELPGRISLQNEDEIVEGEGYEFSLSELEKCPDLREIILERGKEYDQEHRVRYLNIYGTTVHVFIQGSRWYEVELQLRGDQVTDLYCDCPYPGLCKHAVAAALLLRKVVADEEIPQDTPAVLMERSFFHDILQKRSGRINL